MNLPPYDSLGTFLVFLIGVPALVVQFMPVEVRSLIMKRRKHRWRFAFYAGIWIAVALFVSLVAIATGLNCTLNETNRAVCMPPLVQFAIPEVWLWSATFFLLTCITIAASITVIYRYGRRTILVRDWADDAMRNVNHHARIDPKMIHDLIELGRQSEGGLEKDIVLQALYRITQSVSESKVYCGDSLEILLEGLASIVITDPHMGNSRNFETVMDILQSVIAVVPLGENGAPPDMLHAVGTLNTTGQVAVRHLKTQETAKPIVSGYLTSLNLAAERHPKLATVVSEALRDIGIGAIETDQMFLAIKAFEKLEIRIESQAPSSVRGEVVHDTLALLAHFWTAGPTARGYVHKQISEITPFLAGSVQDALLAAQQHAARTSLFKTADRIGEMAVAMNST